jgi:predicted ATPase
MRIRNIRIGIWRHFENIELKLEDNTNLVCLVGANGTGKSHLLELIAACAYKLGLSPGFEIPRGDPFSDPHDFSLQFYLAEGVSDAVDQSLKGEEVFQQWDRTLTIEDRNLPDNSLSRITAGGIANENQSIQFAKSVIDRLRQSKEVHFLSLDADRAYPKKNINIHEIAQAYEIDWEGLEYTRGRSFKTSTMLYDEWIKYFLAQENQTGTRLMQNFRKAKKFGATPPEFKDYFEEYASSLQKVLPHLLFTGVDPKHRTLLFDTTGLELSFDQLSGGEREITFLVGQIDRFGLRQGIFLLDEPELHLNADLIRTWVDYLTSTVSTGQIWLATHSLEAVEAAGQQATFVLERNEKTRKVDGLVRLDRRPILSALSRAVGTPAFSITQLLFVFIEGEEGVGERERFRKLAGLPQNVRFMECGSCNEVLRRVVTIKALAKETVTGIRIGGIVDRDYHTDAAVSALYNEFGIFVLPVHEVENFFLHPETLSVLLKQNGRSELTPLNLILDAADKRAGIWIFQNTMATPNAKTFPDMKEGAKERAKSLTWTDFGSNRDAAIQSIVDASGYNGNDLNKLQGILEISAKFFARKREEIDFWKICEGKQVLNDVARAIGFAGTPNLIQASFSVWERDEDKISSELVAFREYLNSI